MSVPIKKTLAALFSLSLLWLLAPLHARAQKEDFVSFTQEPHSWVDSVYQRLSLRERVGQLFMVRAHTDRGQQYQDSVAAVIKQEQLGGVVLFQGTPTAHALLINRYQSLSKVPLWIAMDGEWGLGMRLPDSTISYPYQMTLGAIQQDSLIYEMGRQIAKDYRRLGIHINFAPVVDINNNPLNPVINYRSFGQDKQKVFQKADAYLRGMEKEGILSSLKHFPGHGDTGTDSHHSLPLIPHNSNRLHEVELFAFRQLINRGAPAVMIAHLQIPAFERDPKLPSSLSRSIISGLLKNELQFKGLIFSDAMDMGAISEAFGRGEAELMAFQAGMDVLELAKDSRLAIDRIITALQQKQLTEAELEKRVKRILAAKYWLGLQHLQAVDTAGLIPSLNRTEAMELNQMLADRAVTLLKGKQALSEIDSSAPTLLINMGPGGPALEQELKKHFSQLSVRTLTSGQDSSSLQRFTKEIPAGIQLILAIHDTRARPLSRLDLTGPEMNFIRRYAPESHIVLLANPYTVSQLTGIEDAKSLIVTYQNQAELQKAAAKVLSGQLQPSGKLPVRINPHFTAGYGL